MRILVIGQAAFGAKVFETLVEKGEDIVAVYCPPDRAGGRPDPLKEAAQARHVPVYQPTTYKDDSVFEEYKSLRLDLTVMAFVTDIIPERFFQVPASGTINYHPSLLPRHRGASAINWAVIMGDKRTGLSIFWPDGGIDTGPVLLQKEVAITEEDTTGSVYFNKLFPMGVDALVESVALVKEGNAPRIVQDEAGATYEPPCDDRVAGIDWNKPARELFNLVRGCDPQPGAFAYWKGEVVRFYAPRLVEEDAAKPPGTVVSLDDQGVHVAVNGGKLCIGRMKPEPGKKLAAAQFASEHGIEPGARFDAGSKGV
ncbi:methionyl-tRNA formyltransferase [Thermodesulfobacteriota bacterium]